MDLVTVGGALEETSRLGNCKRRHVGAMAISRDFDVIASAANGTPRGTQRCDEGGCVRCNALGQQRHGMNYDLCVCVHAEEAVIAICSRDGRSSKEALLITSYQACIMCSKLLVASGIIGIRYIDAWSVPEVGSGLAGLSDNYKLLLDCFPEGCSQIAPEALFLNAWD